MRFLEIFAITLLAFFIYCEIIFLFIKVGFALAILILLLPMLFWIIRESISDPWWKDCE